MHRFGSELDRMLKGKKRLAIFYKFSDERFDDTGGQNFEQYVEIGRIGRGVFFVAHPSGRKIRYVAYFLLGERWRFDLYKMLKKSTIDSSWSSEKEQIERLLLDNIE